MGYLDGFAVTLRQHRIFGGKRVTGEYSGGREYAKGDDSHDVKSDKPERMHGRHVLNKYEDGMEKCIGCELCAGVCPAKCIYVRGADNPIDEPVSPGERFGFIYEINRDDAIYTKTELVVGDDGKPQKMPWEDWREGDDVLTSGWMRATASSGDETFDGLVGWSGELGYGVRAAQGSQFDRDASQADTPTAAGSHATAKPHTRPNIQPHGGAH